MYLIFVVGIICTNFFPDTDRSWKKNWPPIVELTWKMMNEKKEQTSSGILKRQHEKERKQRLDDTMLGFQSNILPSADGCHPNITIGTHSNKIDRFNALNPLQLEKTATDDDEDERVLPMKSDDDDDEYEEPVKAGTKRASYGTQVDDDGTRHYTTADGTKNISYKKNAPQNGKLIQNNNLLLIFALQVTILSRYGYTDK